tara:strand:- start:89 stop:295 length:207 start_codon:yes stop_codon:yes gene_type:complete
MSAQPTDSRKAYLAGWKAGQDATAEKITRADSRKAPVAWYIGFYDAEAGNTQFAGMPTLAASQRVNKL